MLKPPGKYAHVNGLKMYYEVHGHGDPLILLHGGVGSIGMFGEVLERLSQCCQVVAVDLQAHGRTADIDRPLSFESMADDIAALLQSLRLDETDVMGYSLGGGVALRTAIQHPQAVRKLVLVSTPFKRDGWLPDVLAGMAGMVPEAAEGMKQMPFYQNYASLAPRPEDWSVLISKLGQLLAKEYDWTEAVRQLKMPVMLVVGDADSVRTAHAVEFFELLGGGKKDAGWDGTGMSNARLAILPGITHYDIFSSPALADTVLPFLNATIPVSK